MMHLDAFGGISHSPSIQSYCQRMMKGCPITSKTHVVFGFVKPFSEGVAGSLVILNWNLREGSFFWKPWCGPEGILRGEVSIVSTALPQLRFTPHEYAEKNLKVKSSNPKHEGFEDDLVGGFSPTHLKKWSSKLVHLPQGLGWTCQKILRTTACIVLFFLLKGRQFFRVKPTWILPVTNTLHPSAMQTQRSGSYTIAWQSTSDPSTRDMHYAPPDFFQKHGSGGVRWKQYTTTAYICWLMKLL